MKSTGIDIGSRTIAMVVLEDGHMTEYEVLESGPRPVERALTLLGRQGKDTKVVATGYGRHALKEALGAEIITEIKAHALGAHHLFPACRTVIDIGGQDCKVISVSPRGQVLDFLMNDKCAAGTGKFLEVMANTLQLHLDELSRRGVCAKNHAKITSMCTVFAESEIISLLSGGTDINSLARGLLLSVFERIRPMLARVGAAPQIIFSGGVARLPGIASLFSELLGTEIIVPPNPQVVGALGAALSALGGDKSGI